MCRRVLIVDDHAAFRAIARLYLESEGVEVVGEAADGDEAIAATRSLQPSLVLLDVHLPGDNGFAVAARLAALDGPPQVVLISSRSLDDVASGLGDIGVAGFILKSRLSVAAIDALVG